MDDPAKQATHGGVERGGRGDVDATRVDASGQAPDALRDAPNAPRVGTNESTTPAIGTIFQGKYRIERVLGEGGMGVVLAATHLQFESLVAIKLLHPDVVKEAPEVMLRLVNEARAVVRLKSEHVARVMDVGALASGEPYLVMEYLEGRDLASLLRERGALPVAMAVSYILQVCEGMSQAHAQGIVHRDLKPANLFITTASDGQPCLKVLDFGIAKIAHAGGFDMTRTLTMMGTPLYMSPEQMRSSRDVDARADVWSIGVILYQMLTGEVPFRGRTTTALVLAVADEPLPPLRRADVPRGLWDVVTACLAKEPSARMLSVGQIARGLVPYGDDEARALAVRISRVLGEPIDARMRAPERGAERMHDGAATRPGGHDVASRRPLGSETTQYDSAERAASAQGGGRSGDAKHARQTGPFREDTESIPRPPMLGDRVPRWMVPAGLCLCAAVVACVALMAHGRSTAESTSTPVGLVASATGATPSGGAPGAILATPPRDTSTAPTTSSSPADSLVILPSGSPSGAPAPLASAATTGAAGAASVTVRPSAADTTRKGALDKGSPPRGPSAFGDRQ